MSNKRLYELKTEEQQKNAELKMIRDHKRATKKQKLQSFRVPKDPCNTIFFCKETERGQKAVADYERVHKQFWQ